MKVTDSGKHSTLLRYIINTAVKSSIVKVPGVNLIDFFALTARQNKLECLLLFGILF